MHRCDRSRFRRIMLLFAVFSSVVSAALFSCPGVARATPLRVVYNPGVAPLKFENESGDAMGLFADFWRLWAEKVGVSADIERSPTFEESLECLSTGSADLHAGIFRTPERESYLAFSEPMLSLDYFLFSHPAVRRVRSIEDGSSASARAGIPRTSSGPASPFRASRSTTASTNCSAPRCEAR